MKSVFPTTSPNSVLDVRAFLLGSPDDRSATGRRIAAGIGAALAKVVDRMLTWQQRGADRRHLLQLDDHMLADVGLSHADVELEAGKPFWKP